MIVMPYKDKERQRKAVRELMREHRKRKKQEFLDMKQRIVELEEKLRGYEQRGKTETSE